MSYPSRVDSDRIDLDFFATVSDAERDRASMILSCLIFYGFEPNSYWHDEERSELLLKFLNQEHVVAFSLITVGLSEEF
ncbi:MAG: hypothetical protein ABEK50_06560 [bacterium]